MWSNTPRNKQGTKFIWQHPEEWTETHKMIHFLCKINPKHSNTNFRKDREVLENQLLNLGLNKTKQGFNWSTSSYQNICKKSANLCRCLSEIHLWKWVYLWPCSVNFFSEKEYFLATLKLPFVESEFIEIFQNLHWMFAI